MKSITDIIIANTFPPFKGGISRYLKGIADILSKYCNLIVITRVSSRGIEKSEYTVKRSVLYGISGLINKIVHYIITIYYFFLNIDSVKRLYAGAPVPYGLICLILRFFKPSIKIYVFTYGSELLHNENRMHSYIRDFVLNKADIIITISNYSGNIVKQITDKPVIMAPPGYNGPFKKKHHSKNKTLRIITVASLTPRKGQHLVIEALSRINDRSVIYDIIGNGPRKDALNNMIKEYGLSANVCVRTGLSDNEVHNFYSQADVFIMPTYRDNYDVEGFGIVYLEAGAHCLPIIASPVGGVIDIIEENKNGIFVREKNIDDIADAILRFAYDPQLRESMGKEAYNTAKCFTYQSSVQNIIDSFGD